MLHYSSCNLLVGYVSNQGHIVFPLHLSEESFAARLVEGIGYLIRAKASLVGILCATLYAPLYILALGVQIERRKEWFYFFCLKLRMVICVPLVAFFTNSPIMILAVWKLLSLNSIQQFWKSVRSNQSPSWVGDHYSPILFTS